MAYRQRDDVPKFPIAPILEALGFEDVPEGYGWRPIKCIFHDDQQASASVNTELGAFACHGCDMRGDGLKLLQVAKRLDFREALELAQHLTAIGSEPQHKQPRTRRVSEILGVQQ